MIGAKVLTEKERRGNPRLPHSNTPHCRPHYAHRLVLVARDLLLLTQLEVLGALDHELLLGLALLALQAEGDLLGGLGLQGGQCKDQGPSFLWQCIVKALTWSWKMWEHKNLSWTHVYQRPGIGCKHAPSCAEWAWSDHRTPAASCHIASCPVVRNTPCNHIMRPYVASDRCVSCICKHIEQGPAINMLV